MVHMALAADSSTVNGWISDSQCAAKGAAEGHAACTQKCIAKGAKMVVVTDSDKKILTVDNPDALKGHEGHHVRPSPDRSPANSIHVESAKML